MSNENTEELRTLINNAFKDMTNKELEDKAIYEYKIPFLNMPFAYKVKP